MGIPGSGSGGGAPPLPRCWVPCPPWMRLRRQLRWSAAAGSPRRPSRTGGRRGGPIATSAIDSSSSSPASAAGPVPADGPVSADPEGPPFSRATSRRHRRGHRAGARRLSLVVALLDQVGPVARRGADRQHRPAAPPPDPVVPAAGRRRRRCTTSSSTSGWAGSVSRTWPSDRCPVSSGVVTLPLVWLAGRRLGGARLGWVALLLVATSPFAIRYATESRMYSLVALLTVLGFLALDRSLRNPRPGNLVAVGVVTGLLLYTHYWSLYLVGTVLLWLLWQAWRGRAGMAGRGPGLVGGHRRRVPHLPALVAHLPLPVPPHRDALGHHGQLRRDGQRGVLVRRWGLELGARPGPDVLRPGRAGGLRHGHRPPPHRPRHPHPPADPAADRRGDRHPGRRPRRRAPGQQHLRRPLRVGGVHPADPGGGRRGDLLPRPPGPVGRPGHRRGRRPGRIHPRRHHQPDPGRAGGRGPSPPRGSRGTSWPTARTSSVRP